jgi:hypothetical protein
VPFVGSLPADDNFHSQYCENTLRTAQGLALQPRRKSRHLIAKGFSDWVGFGDGFLARPT